jgi:hypothetical protein
LTWRALEPRDALELMRGYEKPWWVGGGWALDLFLGERTRQHDDLDVVVLRGDQERVWDHFAGWDLEVVDGAELRPWRGERLELPVHNLWARRTGGPWELELLLMESDAREWRFRRDERITLPLAQVGMERDGVPHLVPEIPLLYKAKAPRADDEADFASVLPQLSDGRRRWLARAIRSQDPSHPWLAALETE